MTTLNWVKRNIKFALEHDETLEELRISLQSIVTRLNISPLENGEKETIELRPRKHFDRSYRQQE